MSTPYVGEIRLIGFTFPLPGWALCDGSSLSISNNDVLFNLISTTYGGDGVNTFNVPDLRGRVLIHQGTGSESTYVIGQFAGSRGGDPDAWTDAHAQPSAVMSGSRYRIYDCNG
jgi:microcystin-dependent protein